MGKRGVRMMTVVALCLLLKPAVVVALVVALSGSG
jgi:hypothetical protein